MRSRRFAILAAALLLLMMMPIGASAQDDSTTFINGKWSELYVTSGVRLRQCHFTEKSLFGANEFVSVLIVAPRKRIAVAESAPGTLEKTSEIAAKQKAVAAVNGSFFRMKAPYGPTTYVRIDGKFSGIDNEGSSRKRDQFESGCLAITGRKAVVAKALSKELDWEDGIEAEDILSSGPLLISGGVPEVFKDVKFNTNRHPRTAVGILPDGSKVFVVVDGRSSKSQGVTIGEMQKIMMWLGCTDALNLDGGGSSTMVVRGKIVNHPCDNKAFDSEGERSVANAIIIK
ncbi:MAG: phosphodiester glycosidase family protein [Bacteroidales bacterium]|nr:phosphodiester glycosidase family protein [Bacteroidales bacterium]